MNRSASVLLLAFFIAAPAWGGVPQEISHQGVVSVNGTRFDGTGLFRFAIVDLDTGQNLWTNDGTNVGVIGTPDGAVSLPVNSGVYSVRLGNTNLANMGPIAPSVFSKDNTALRIWFDDGVNGAEQLVPDHKIAASPYTHRANDGVPVGTIIAFGGSSSPDGWLPCDGSTVPIADYFELSVVLGTNWGAGDGSTTFHLPDLRGRFLRGQDAGAGRDPNVGSRLASNSGGAIGDVVGSAQEDAFQGHIHILNDVERTSNNLVAPGWNTLPAIVAVGPGNQGNLLTWRVFEPSTWAPNGTARWGHETRPKNVNVGFIIKY